MNRNRVCPVERAGSLDNCLRRWLQNPRKILGPYVAPDMTVLDVGCGPGFFTLALARLVGPAGRVIAVDLQEGMLDIVRRKIAGTDLEGRIALQRCAADRLNVAEKVDFALAFYIVHEVPDPAVFFRDLAARLRPGGQCLVVEPAFHVPRTAFARSLQTARAAGFEIMAGPRQFLNRTAVLKRNSA